jgi:hypothetical protein
MEDPVQETFEQLLFWIKAGRADPGSPQYEEARNKLTVKLAVLLASAIENFRSAMESNAQQSQSVNAILVGLNRALVRLTWVLVVLGVIATVFAILS